MPEDRKIIEGSERAAPDAPALGPADPAQTVEVSVYLKRDLAPAAGPRTRGEIAADRTAALAGPIKTVTDFAAAAGLAVTLADPARRLVKLKGPASAMAAAFGAQMSTFGAGGGPSFRGRTGPLSAPASVASVVEAVLGLDQRPIATPKSIRLRRRRATSGNLPNAITALYGFPTTAGAGKGQTIAIIELGGGVSSADTATAFSAMGLAPPQVVSISVDGAPTAAGVDKNADGEVALDVQVAGAGAPGATLAVYFAPNTDQGFVDAIAQAAHDQTHGPGVMSISWGSAESAWTAQGITAMNSAFQDAASLGVSIFAASGDGLATDGQTDGAAHVDFPSSSPFVVGCGGSRLGGKSGKAAGETVWNSNGGGTGGGVSDRFARPAYQASAGVPAGGLGGAGRGVPDVAGDADPGTGYRVQVGGQSAVYGGTSAVSPLWAGLFALIGERTGRAVGPPHAVLYANPSAFNDITKGDNRSGGVGYAAAKGWDACTGLGTPKGAAIAALFK